MRIISTNTGIPQSINWNGKQIQTGIFKYPSLQPIYLGKEHVEHDTVIDRKHHGGADKACYIYSADHYPFWHLSFPDLVMPWGMFGENLTVKGFQENSTYIGDIFEIGETTVQVTQPRQPCFKLGIRFGNPGVVKQFAESGFSGMYVRVLKTGFVQPNDKMIRTEKKDSITIQKVFELLYSSDFNKDELSLALENPFLADSCRKDLFRRWKKFI